jgi:tetratricopeptide (TPR) repeat protein
MGGLSGYGQMSAPTKLEEYTQMFEIDYNSSTALRQRALMRYANQDVVGANSDLSRALTLNPNDRAAAEILLDLWRRQVSAYPKSVNSHLGLARAFLLTGDLDSAQAEYKEVVRLDPENPQLPAARAYVKQALAKRAALKYFETAKTLAGASDVSDAYEKVNEALALCPKNASMLLFKGQLAERAGNYAEARQLYLIVLNEEPKNVQAAKGLKTLKTKANEGGPTTALKEQANKVGHLARQESLVLPAPARAYTTYKSRALTTSSKAPTTPQLTSETPQAAPALATSSALASAFPDTQAPASSGNEVSSLASFAGSVRDVGISGKNKDKQVEKSARSSLQAMPDASQALGSTAVPVLSPLPDNISQTSDAVNGASVPLAPPIAAPAAQAGTNFAASSSWTSTAPSQPNGVPANGLPVRLELVKVSPSNGAMILRVALRNDGEEPMHLPGNLKVAVKAPGQTLQYVKARFYTDSVPAHGTAEGTIRVPSSQFSPATDVYLPNFPGDKKNPIDVHLTTPIASL